MSLFLHLILRDMEASEVAKGYFLRFYGNKASVVWESVEKVGKRFHVEHKMEVARKRAYSGFLSKAAQNVIHKRLYAWMEACRIGNHEFGRVNAKEQVRLVFITLTLSGKQRHSDQWIKKNMLELFIKRLQSNYGVKHYFWKAEVQANGNLHFHLIIDKYIDYLMISKHWNEIQRSKGYLDLYFATNGHYSPPSTHVRELSGMWDGIGYAMKYVSKDEHKRPVQGAIFRFSDSLVNLEVPAIQITHEYEQEWTEFTAQYTKSMRREEFWTSYRFLTKKRGFKQPEFIARETRDYYTLLFSHLYSSDIFLIRAEEIAESHWAKVVRSFKRRLIEDKEEDEFGLVRGLPSADTGASADFERVNRQLSLFKVPAGVERFKS